VNEHAIIETPEEREELRFATKSHVVPFVFWIVCIFLLGQFAFDDDDIFRAWVYAAQTVIGAGLLFYYRPWRWYAPLNVRHIPLALAVGVGVFGVWIFPQTAWLAERAPRFASAYATYMVFPPWKEALAPEQSPFDPAWCGWGLALMRLAGSAFVIAIIEEFFWRGWLYRWMLARNFLKADLGFYDRGIFVMVSFVFALEHAQYLVGFFAGIAYLWLMIRTRDIWAAALAHVVTNFLLGVYVLVAGAYQHW